MNGLQVCLVFVLALGIAHGLKCYTCAGSSSFVGKGDCGDTYEKDPDHLKMCNATAGEVFCRKEKIGANKVYTELDRGCTAQCEDQNVAYTKRVVCCQTDGCNSGTSVVASLFVLVCATLTKWL